MGLKMPVLGNLVESPRPCLPNPEVPLAKLVRHVVRGLVRHRVTYGLSRVTHGGLMIHLFPLPIPWARKVEKFRALGSFSAPLGIAKGHLEANLAEIFRHRARDRENPVEKRSGGGSGLELPVAPPCSAPESTKHAPAERAQG